MSSRIRLAFSVVAVVAGSAVDGAAPPAVPATTSYRKALQDSRASTLVDVEALFALAVTAGKEILADITKADEVRFRGGPAKPAITALEGLIIATDEALVAQPDPAYFASVAEMKGRPVDRDFFALLVATKPDGVWAIYWQQQTDVTGCVRFDLPELPSLYSRWVEFNARLPAAYGSQVREELKGPRRRPPEHLRVRNCRLGRGWAGGRRDCGPR